MSCRRRSNSAREPFFCMGCDVCDCRARVAIGRHPKRTHPKPKRSPPLSPAPSRARPCTVIALCPGPLHPYTVPGSPSCTFPCTRAPLCPGPLHPYTVPVHRYRALPRSPPCPSAYTPAPSPCTVIARCPVPLHLPVHPCTVIALCPGPLPAPSRAPVHRPRAPLSRSAPVPFTRTPSPCTVIALCPGPLHLPLHPTPLSRSAPVPFLHLPVHPRTVPVHRYRSLPRSPAPSRARPCTVISRPAPSLPAPSLPPVHRPRAPLSRSAPVPFSCVITPSPCTVIALCPVPSLPLRVHPCSVPVHRYHSLPRSPAPSRAPMHRPRAPLSRSAPVPFLHLPVHPCTAPMHRYRALPGPLQPCTVPVHRYRTRPGPLHTPSPCTVIALCPGPLHLPVHPCTVPVHRDRSLPRSPAPSRAPSRARPCTVIALCPGPHPYTVPVHRYRALPRSPAPSRAPVHRYRSLPRSPPCPSVHPCTFFCAAVRLPVPVPTLSNYII